MSVTADVRADNPIVQSIYTADPAPLVYDGRVWAYTGHDEDGATFFTMNEWRVYSSADMANWTDHGSPLAYSDFSWARGDAWAAHVIERDGKFYFYVTVTANSGARSIGVAVADSPTGPFEDPLGRALVTGSGCGDIDPAAYVDGDGQAYLYWGNPNLCYVRLNQDMISYQGGVVKVPMTTASFGVRNGDAQRATLYEEGPWLFKREALYYMVYAAGGIPEYISYSTSSSPAGPWAYQGVIMPTEGASFTNHPGIIQFKDQWYFFYHNGALPGGGGYARSVSVERFAFGGDGSIPRIAMTREGAPQVGVLDPFQRVEAETMAWSVGIETEESSAGGQNVANIENGDYIKLKGVDFGTGAVSFEASVASAGNGGTVELRLGETTGDLIGTCEVEPTGAWQTWQTTSCDVTGAEGTHDLYLVFKGSTGLLFNIDFWRFVPRDRPVTGSGGSGTGGSGSGTGGGSSSDGGGPGSGGLASSGGGEALPSSGGQGSGGVPLASGGGTMTGGGGQEPFEPTSGGCSFGRRAVGGSGSLPLLALLIVRKRRSIRLRLS